MPAQVAFECREEAGCDQTGGEQDAREEAGCDQTGDEQISRRTSY